MNGHVFEAARQLCADIRQAKYMVEHFRKMAALATEEHRYDDAAVCFENAANWSRKCRG